ncbi:MAG: DUF4332 domain-containing protein, partial [Gemmatimonadota bacterium]|nr:DUF4332 domain-containing protein [Gemmatimonadota bacterium]
MNELMTLVCPDDAKRLEAAGVDSVAELARRNPTNLAARIFAGAPEGATLGPSAQAVADWVRRARTTTERKTTMRNGSRALLTIAALIMAVTTPTQVDAQYVWENATELSFVSTGGNASSNTLGLKALLSGSDDVNSFQIQLGGIRGETNFRILTATGTASNFTVNEDTDSQLTAESYFARSRYDRSFGVAYGFGGIGWDRNTFAGIQNRYSGVVGLGKAWVDDDASRFKTDLGVTYTIQKDVSPVPGADDGFGGLRLSVEAMRQLSQTTQFTSMLIADENVEDTEDFRADWTNALSVSLSDRLALKTSLQ